jgi:hypothetical protein
MPNQMIVGRQDGPRLTVASMMKTPTLIPKRIISMTGQAFLVDTVLRSGSDTASGVVLYFETTPLFAADAPQVMDDFAAIPTTNGSLGTPKVVRVVRRALGLRVSKTMIDRNNTDAVNVQITQIRNTMVRAWEDAFFSALIANPNLQTLHTDAPWDGTGTGGLTHIRKDVNAAKFLVKNASSDGNGQNGSNKLQFKADTLVLSTETETDFLDSDEVTKIYVGNLASSNLQYTGTLPNKFLNLDVVTSWRLDNYVFGGALVLERKTVGFISDERKLGATPMYGEGGGPNGGPTESWRTDTTRASAIGIDQPLAAVVITGVHA